MDTQALAAFVEVAESGSFSRAGETLHLSQPAISKRIAVLEEQLDKSLFDRVGRSITLTDAGRTLLPYARRVLHDVEDGRRALSHLSDQVSGRLSIGTSHHIGLHRLPPVLREFTRLYPSVDLDIHFMDSEVACQSVLAGKLEIGIVTLPTQSLPSLEMRLIWPDPLTVVVAPEHPLAKKKHVALTELADHPAVLPDEATYTHRIVKAALQKHGVEPRIRLATNYLETLKMLVNIGLGWSVLPRSMLDSTICAVNVTDLSMQRDLGVVWHERRTLSGGARALLKQLQD
ncbi:LysR family transcriptional regulator [Stenotrophobium rhamnosiphilum]|uniref:LysR family transcriptional regulator n=1 Tax=Stenotrophobium rhamnosiphilum TaxID=2029166 RepID=A0A2T5MEV0_9GAMM|nr:LysR family transcriptional regulator [Stenotrophobium rhamnosiphilum]PTU31110.1 LysR family transcriptional regulator [Stenotrophobium rhamnosiphilum]